MKWLQLLKTDVERSTRDNGLKHWGKLEPLKAILYPSLQAMVFYRVGHALHERGYEPLAQVCHAASITLTGCDIHPAAEIGEGLLIAHPVGIAVAKTATLGAGVTLGPHTVVGRITPNVPKTASIGDGVFLGAGSIVLGEITIGKQAAIGANALVTKDVPAGATVVAPRGEILTEGERRPFIASKQRLDDIEHQLSTIQAEQEELRSLLTTLVAEVKEMQSSHPAKEPNRSSKLK